jgi:mono/diheme cytochrome c family protein
MIRHSRKLLIFLAGALPIVCGAVVSAAPEQTKTDDRGVFMAIAKAPAKARDWKNPYDGQADALAAGQKLFLQHCSSCHGENGRGSGRAVNLHLSTVQNARPGELEWFLRNGNLWGGMPSWSGLPEQRRWQIVTYLKSMRR